MATAVGIMGESGTGKTHSYKFLPPDKTFVFDCDKKGLSFRNWKALYNTESKNYFRTSDVKKDIIPMLRRIDKEEEFSHIKYVIIDTLNGIMVDDEINRMKEKAYDKWQDLAVSVYKLLDHVRSMRDDLIIFCYFHTQDLLDDSGNHFYRIQTSGQKLQKIKLESKLPIVIMSMIEEGDLGKNNFYFETQARKSTAKTPEGMFKEFRIPNNALLVAKAIERYEGSATSLSDEKVDDNKESSDEEKED